MLNLRTRFGRHVNRRLRQEKIVWLTTVDSDNRPQPRPVWFHWDGRTVLIFSEKNKAKLRHVAHNSGVSLNFNTDEEGGDVAVLVGNAVILDKPPSPHRVKIYLRKYRKGIKDLEMTVAEFKGGYTVAILITPQAMRGFF